MRRLVKHLKSDYDVKIVDAKAPSDIHLAVISGIKPGTKNVLRLDGVYYDVGRLKMNVPILKALKAADGVVYQSAWCQTFVQKMLRAKPRSSTVVWNGVDQSQFKLPKQKNPHGFDKVFVSCAHWRPNKRPEAMAEAFIQANNLTDLNLGFYFIGKVEKRAKVDHPNIIYHGTVSNDSLPELYAQSDYMVHICHIDACPNSVVEGLSAGLPVLSNNLSGTPEIVGKSGIILPIDKPFDFKPLHDINSVGSSSVRIKTLRQGMLSMLDKDWNIERPDLDIKVSARKYYDYFCEILKS